MGFHAVKLVKVGNFEKSNGGMVFTGGMRAAAAAKSGGPACLFESCLGNWNTSEQ